MKTPGLLISIALYVLFIIAPSKRNTCSLRPELSQVIIDVDLKELAPLLDCHRAEHLVRSPICSRSCMPTGIKDFQQLLLFDVKVKLRGGGILKPLGSRSPTGCSGNQSTRIHRNNVRDTR